jgi:mono/diheme cytochrome c family protein
MRMSFAFTFFGGMVVFTIMVGMVVFMPVMMNNPSRTIIAHPYTDEQARGRDLFKRNGCNYCHTQYVREQDTAMGDLSDGGNYMFDNPMILGSERTGPDLSYVGRKRAERWEIEHLRNPRDLSPLSIMASYDFLPDDELEAIATYLFSLGDRVAQERMIRPPDTYRYMTSPYPYQAVTPATDGSAQGWDLWREAGLQDGKEIFVTYCLTCHGCAGNGLGSYGGTMTVTPADYRQDPFRNMPDDQFFWHVSEGLPGTLMPVWKASLSEEQRWHVVMYLQQIFSRPVMHDPDEGDPWPEYAGRTNPLELTIEVLDEGKAIFTRECMVCHGDAGQGHGPYGDFIQPGPPNFSDDYSDFTDADYFWRISEGVPWTAMPTWRLQYSEEDRWKLTHYVRSIFTQTQGKPPEPPDGENFNYPDFFREITSLPENVSYTRGRIIFLENCAHCHGLAGDGSGWDGQYLDPKPSDFRETSSSPVAAGPPGEHLAIVTFGIQDTAMPVWGEWMRLDDRWDVLKFAMVSFMAGMPVNNSVYDGQVADNFVLADRGIYQDEGHVIDTQHGQELYAQYCATCHGIDGMGNGPGTVGMASGSPAAFPSNLPFNYLMWRTWEGVPGSVMYPFQWLLEYSDIWDICDYMDKNIIGQRPIGRSQASQGGGGTSTGTESQNQPSNTSNQSESGGQ